MHLIENYASVSRLKIGKPDIKTLYYPLPFEDNYICFCGSSGMSGKNYRHWNMVFDLIRELNYKIVQVGGKDDPHFNVDHNICGKTNTLQFFDVVKRASLVLSGDTSCMHIATVFDRPLVTIFGLTSPNNSGPFFGNKKNQRVLEVDREKYPPSFNPNDDCVNTILPETIAEAIINLHNEAYPEKKSDLNTNLETVHIGDAYNSVIFEFVPDHIISPQAFQRERLICRGDYLFNEDNIIENLKLRKIAMVLDQPIDLEKFMPYRNNILQLNFEIKDDTDEKFIRDLSRSPINAEFFTFSENIGDLRLKFLDDCIIHEIKPKERIESAVGKRYKTNKLLLADGNIYGCKTAWEKGAQINATQTDDVHDTFDFWQEIDHFWIYDIKE